MNTGIQNCQGSSVLPGSSTWKFSFPSNPIWCQYRKLTLLVREVAIRGRNIHIAFSFLDLSERLLGFLPRPSKRTWKGTFCFSPGQCNFSSHTHTPTGKWGCLFGPKASRASANFLGVLDQTPPDFPFLPNTWEVLLWSSSKNPPLGLFSQVLQENKKLKEDGGFLIYNQLGIWALNTPSIPRERHVW